MTTNCRVLLAACVLAILTHTGSAQPLLRERAWGLVQPSPGYAALENAHGLSTPAGAGTPVRVTVLKPAEPFYHVQIAQTVSSAVPAGNRVRLRFYARSQAGNPLRAVVEKAGPPFAAVIDIQPVLTPTWKCYEAVGVSPGYGPNGLAVRLQIGHQAGAIEFAGITLEDLGPDPAIAEAREALRPEAIQARISKYRMGDLAVTVRDSRGRAVPNASVSISQKRHAFLFGCNIFSLNPGDSEPWQRQYQERFTALLNYATLPFYWGAFEYVRGRPDYARLDSTARWCASHGIPTKGHPLVWHEVYPSWAPRDPDQAIPLMRARVSEIITHYRGQIHYWDVLNEANAAPSYAQTGEGAWIKRDGPAAVVATALDWAREASRGAGNTLVYNDYDTGQANLDLLTALQKRVALPDAIGIQSHMHGGAWPVTQVWATAQRFARFGRPIHFTEVTVLSGPSRVVDLQHPPTDWVTTPEGEKEQAAYVAQFYTVLFSHPAVRAITWWDLSDRSAWQNAPAGLLRKDMSPKPVYDRLMSLIHGAWWTRAKGATNRSGRFGTRAFYGDYDVTVSDGHGRTVVKSVNFARGSRPLTVAVTL